MGLGRVAAAGILLTGLAGCFGGDSTVTPATPAEAVASTNTALVSDEILWAAADPFDPFVVSVNLSGVTDSEAAAHSVVDHLDDYFKPAGCAKGHVDGATTSITFHDCSGPLGTTGLDGTVNAVYSGAASGVVINIISVNLLANGQVVDLSVAGTYSQSGSHRHVAFVDRTSSALGVGNNVVIFNVAGTATWTKGDRSVKVDDSGQTQLNGRSFTASSSQTLSGTRCPTGTSTLTRGVTRAVTITFSGTPQATFSDPTAATQGPVTTACGI